MIQANKLMLGNWFEFPITGKRQIDGNDLIDWHSKGANPIRLSTEIFKKAGAEIWQNRGAFILKINRQGELIIFPGTTIVGVANDIAPTDYYYLFNGVIIVIRFLHQLQNLFVSLSGNELEIKL